jgi:hypothetical protein
MSPRLTIGIPTLGNRPDLLLTAVGSALAQSVPARVLISAPDADLVTKLIGAYAAHPLVRVVPSPATCLWENWRHAAESCGTEIFAWLQDDDVIAPHMASRAIMALDRNPRAIAWIARLGISMLPGQANWWQATGPLVPMDLLHGGCTPVDGRLLAAGAYVASFALSPAVAFRCTLDALEAVRRCPARGCDLFNERVILAELGRLGEVVCDPAVAGYWVMHGENESRKQVTGGQCEDQYAVMAEHIDGMLQQTPAWQDVFRGWATMVGAENLNRWHEELEKRRGTNRTLDEAADIVKAAMPVTDRPAEPDAEHATSRKARRAERAVRRR